MVIDGWALLTRREQFHAMAIGAGSFIASIVELAALSTTVPFVGLLIDPNSLRQYPAVQTLLARLELPRDRNALLLIGIGVIVCLLAAFFFRMGVYVLVERFSVRLSNRLVRDTMQGCLHSPYAWLRNQNGAQLAQRLVTDVATVGQALYPVVLEIIYGAFIVALGVTAVVLTSPWQATLLTVILGIVALGALAVLNPLAARYAALQRNRAVEGNQIAIEAFSGRKQVKTSRAEHFFTRRYLDKFISGNTARMKLNIVNKAIPTVTLLAGQIAIFVFAFVLVLMDTAVDSVVSQLTFVVLVMSRVLPAVSTMTGSINKLVKTEPSFHGYMALRREIGAWMTAAPEVTDQAAAPEWRRLRLDKVTFSYTGSDYSQLQEVNLVIERGHSYALAGPSGAGKSTLIDILLGLLTPTSGTVRLDDSAVEKETHRAWLRMVGYVPQEPFMMDDTLRRNVAFGVPDAQIDDKEVWRSLDQAQIADVVRALPDGLGTFLGDAGIRFSGGQRQRIAIARALYTRPNMLIFDEATSALDRQTEEELLRTIEQLPGISTRIILSHRPETIARCERVIFIRGGRVEAQGLYSALADTLPQFLKGNAAYSLEPENS